MNIMTEKYRGQISLANLTIKEMMNLAHISVGEALEMYYSSKYILAIEDERTHYRELPHTYQARDILEEFHIPQKS